MVKVRALRERQAKGRRRAALCSAGLNRRQSTGSGADELILRKPSSVELGARLATCGNAIGCNHHAITLDEVVRNRVAGLGPTHFLDATDGHVKLGQLAGVGTTGTGQHQKHKRQLLNRFHTGNFVSQWNSTEAGPGDAYPEACDARGPKTNHFKKTPAAEAAGTACGAFLACC